METTVSQSLLACHLLDCNNCHREWQKRSAASKRRTKKGSLASELQGSNLLGTISSFWLNTNQLELNTQKTKYIIFTHKQKLSFISFLYVSSHVLCVFFLVRIFLRFFVFIFCQYRHVPQKKTSPSPAILFLLFYYFIILQHQNNQRLRSWYFKT